MEQSNDMLREVSVRITTDLSEVLIAAMITFEILSISNDESVTELCLYSIW
jgi:hypothetical protein